MILNRHLLHGILVLALAAAGHGQSPLQISSPSDGTIVNPGQTLGITVMSPTGALFSDIGVVGENPLGISDAGAGVPAQVSIAIPSTLACRRYTLTAIGITTADERETSPVIHIDVERPDMPVLLLTQFQSFIIEAQGQNLPFLLLAKFADGNVLEVTESSKITYQSSNTAVARIDANGMVTGFAPGSGLITATYNNPNGPNLQLSVPITVLPPELTPAPATLVFGAADTPVGIGSSVTLQIALTNTSSGDNSLRVKNISATGDYFETDNCITSTPLGLGASCTISVTFTPTVSGERKGFLNIANSSSVVPTIIPLDGFASDSLPPNCQLGDPCVPPLPTCPPDCP